MQEQSIAAVVYPVAAPRAFVYRSTEAQAVHPMRRQGDVAGPPAPEEAVQLEMRVMFRLDA